MANSICVDNLNEYIIIDINNEINDDNIDIINILQMDGLSKNNQIKELDNKLNIYIKTMYDVIKYFNNSDDLLLSLNNITNKIFYEVIIYKFHKKSIKYFL